MHIGAHAAATPDKPAVIMAGSGAIVTYADLNARSCQLARLLRGAGLQVGDGMAVLMENNPRYPEVLWAGQRSGLYFTAISSRLTVGEAEYIIDDCEAKALVTSYELRDLAAELADRMPQVHTRLMVGGVIPGFEPYEDIVAAQSAEPLPEEWEGMDMLYSSGTTGRPKGIRRALSGLPFGAPDSIALVGQIMWGLNQETVYLSPAPQYHSAPLRFCMAMHRVGATAVIMEHFDAREMLALIEGHHVTMTQCVPTMFVRMLKLPEDVRQSFTVSSLVSVIHAAAPCPVPVKQQMIAWWGPKLYEYYAGTEGNGFVHCNSDEWLAHPGTVGHALSGQVHIVGEDSDELTTGEIGTIYFEGGGEFEYYHDPEKTAASRHPKGWSTLGDIGYLDANGYLYLTDRKANMIISGGVNIYPQEAENVLTMHPKVTDVAVFGVPNEDFGEEVKAVVQPVEMADAGPELERELIAYCRSQLADVKCPRTIDFRSELPRHPTGKLYKRLLKDEYWAGHQTRIL
jgi:acyl-CoA synthetase (AMP-forming)/AMP-acid ligase II